MNLTKELAEILVKQGKSRKANIIKFLELHGYDVIDDTEPETPRYWNLKVKNEDGTMIRIYRSYRDGVKVQLWEPVVVKWSGIPTFEPSGRRSF